MSEELKEGQRWCVDGWEILLGGQWFLLFYFKTVSNCVEQTGLEFDMIFLSPLCLDYAVSFHSATGLVVQKHNTF